MTIRTFSLGSTVVSTPAPGETRLLFEEILERECYLPAAIGLPDRPLIVDVGANVGLASLYFAKRAPGARTILVEAIAEMAAAAEQNVSRWGLDAQVLAAALCPTGVDPVIDYRPKTPGISSLWAYRRDRTQEISARFESIGIEQLEAHDLAVALAGRSERLEVTRVGMDEIVAICAPRLIDLMKVDVEGGEWDIVNEAICSGAVRTLICETDRQNAQRFHNLSQPGWTATIREHPIFAEQVLVLILGPSKDP